MRNPRPSAGLLGLLLASLLAGLIVYRDYGASWDEPEYYEYARSIRYAYSLEDHLEQDFRIEKAFGSASYFHRFYGPAYLLLAGSLVEFLRGTIPGSDFDLWHLVNFLTFLAGGACLFGLARRWMSPLASLGVMLMYILQPILWGSAFINPKDVPFTTFFIAAVWAGYGMVDATLADPPAARVEAPARGPLPHGRKRSSQLAVLLGIGLAVVVLVVCRDPVLSLLERLVRSSITDANSIPGRLLRVHLAECASHTPRGVHS